MIHMLEQNSQRLRGTRITKLGEGLRGLLAVDCGSVFPQVH
jgi:hypothetical protein